MPLGRWAALAVIAVSAQCLAMDLRALPEFGRPDPFGGIVQVDRAVVASAAAPLRLIGARRGYASTHVAVTLDQPGEYTLALHSALPADVYREWFHLNKPDGKYYPDALIPAQLPYRSRLPELDNQIKNQTTQAFWIDFWIPEQTKPGQYPAEITLNAGGQQRQITVNIQVTAAAVPERDAVILDHNSYGTSWMFEQFPKTLQSGDDNALFRLIHAYHRLFHDHRGIFHQLGYGHGGKVGPEFAPELEGSGKGKHIASWDRFDRHYGPLLDGSAFRGSRMGERPIPYVYLPINPEWPASFLWWGEPGYEAEFVNVVSAMERHFREKNWTSTHFEMFFNHKKRYKGFSWDGDETRFARDNDWMVAFRQLLNKAVPADTPVRFLMRTDTSWSMNDQFDRLRNVVNFWVAGEGILSWYPGAVEKLKARGDHVWTYGGTPTVEKVSTAVTLNPLRTWITGSQGFVRWLTVAPGPDPWFGLEGGGETLVYPGERFGLREPVASIRLKLQRNCLQDLALLEAKAAAGTREATVAEVTRRYNGSTPADWRNTAPPLAATPVLDWNNVSIEEAMKPFEARFAGLKGDAWTKVHEYAAGGGQ